MRISHEAILLLCRCIGTDPGNEPVFQRHFDVYYRTLSRPLFDYLRRMLLTYRNVGDARETAQELLHDLLERHFRQIAERTENAKLIGNTAKTLALPARGELFERQVERWTKTLCAWSEEIGGFCSQCDAAGMEFEAEHCELSARVLNEQWPPLWGRGAVLLEWTDIRQPEPGADGRQTAAGAVDPAYEKQVKRLIRETRKRIEREGEEGAARIDDVLDVPGAGYFITHLGTLLAAGAKMRLPVSSFLYLQGRNLVRDHVKKRSVRAEDTDARRFDEEDDGTSAPAEDLQDPHPDQALEQWELLGEYHHALSARVRQAQKSLAEARSPSDKRHAEARSAREQARLARNWQVFELKLIEHTQEEIAEVLGISRDQVRSALEDIKAAVLSLRNGPDTEVRP